MTEELTPKEEEEIKEIVGNAFKIFEPLVITKEDKTRVEDLKKRMIETRREIKLFLKNVQSKQTDNRPLLK